MGITHTVQVVFRSDLPGDLRAECVKKLRELKDCKKPDGTKYIKYFKSGTNNSPEGRGGNIDYMFVTEFENEADREYYLGKDPMHLSFVGWVEKNDIFSELRIFDFEDELIAE